MAAAYWLTRRPLPRRGPISGQIRERRGGPSTWERLMQPAAVRHRRRGRGPGVRVWRLAAVAVYAAARWATRSRGSWVLSSSGAQDAGGKVIPADSGLAASANCFLTKQHHALFGPKRRGSFPLPRFPRGMSGPAASPTGEAYPPTPRSPGLSSKYRWADPWKRKEAADPPGRFFLGLRMEACDLLLPVHLWSQDSNVTPSSVGHYPMNNKQATVRLTLETLKRAPLYELLTLASFKLGL